MTTAAKTIACTFELRPALLALVMAVLCPVLSKPSRADVPVWNRWEHTLISSRAYTNPYQQVTLSVAYRGPGGQQITGHGFWDGDNSFKIRCMFATACVRSSTSPR